MNPRPGSVTQKQIQTLVMAARNQGVDLHELRAMTPQGSLRKLSAAEASAMLSRFGAAMPHPPGREPAPYRGSPQPGVRRLIAPAHEEQIERLLREIWPDDAPAAERWLFARFGVGRVRDLATAQRAGECIAALKAKLAEHRRRANATAART